MKESKKVLKAESDDSRLLKRSILHTDLAKAYRRVGLLRWPQAGGLHDAFEDGASFAKWEFVHTNVTHKKKKGQPVRYTETATVQNKAGKSFKVVKGTQKVDGDWATLCRQCWEARRQHRRGGDCETRVALQASPRAPVASLGPGEGLLHAAWRLVQEAS